MDDLNQVEWSKVRGALVSIERHALQVLDYGHTYYEDELCDIAAGLERQVKTIRDLIGWRAG